MRHEGASAASRPGRRTSLLGVAPYLVPAREATAEIEVKRSRFRSRVVRVETEEAARAVIAEERRVYGTAGHHCSAFVLGPTAATVRSNDDGEPSGTAGPPILDALRGEDLSDVVAVVTRWFGGTLLGTGGLVQAYGDATRAALVPAGTCVRRLRLRLAGVASTSPRRAGSKTSCAGSPNRSRSTTPVAGPRSGSPSGQRI